MKRRPEARLEREILLALGRVPHVALYRNEVGVGYTGAIRPQIERALLDMPEAQRRVVEILNRNRISYGLGIGSPDLFGAVGGRAFGLELKSERGRLDALQRNWHEAAARRGIVVGVVRSVDEALAVIERVRGSL